MRLRSGSLLLMPYQLVYIAVLLLITLVVIWLYRDIDRTFQAISKRFITNQSEIVGEFSQNIEKRLKTLVPDSPVKRLASDEALREHVEHILSLFSTRHLRYVYILYLDEKGRLRYLADGSYEVEEKGLFGQKYDPENERWRDALHKKELVYAMQKDFTGLWLTFYYPLHIWNSPPALLVFDVSADTFENFESIMHSIRDLLEVLSIVLMVLLVTSIIWSVLFYVQRKKNSIDPLTGLFNRNLLERISHRIDLDRTSVILADIDHFKRINDKYGHDAGDFVLKSVAEELKRSTRPEDIVVRYGGEEFLVFINDVTDPKAVVAIARRMHEAFADRVMRYRGHDLKVTISVGVVPVPGKVMDLSEAILNADKMLYVAKTAGRNRVAVLGEENDLQRPLLFKEVAEAIEEGRLLFHYQPIVCARDLSIVKYEVLARLSGEKGRVIYPGEFIGAIRGTSVYREMSKHLIAGTFRVIREHGVNLTINFDINDFLDETLFEVIYDTLKNQGDDARRLTIELLEENPIPDVDGLIERVERLKALGIEIAIDDFGKGYAGLDYILHFHPHILKVDRSVVARLHTHEEVLPILRSIVETCRTIGITTVAEGVEDEETFKRLRQLGFDCLQGYYIAPPSERLLTREELFFDERAGNGTKER